MSKLVNYIFILVLSSVVLTACNNAGGHNNIGQQDEEQSCNNGLCSDQLKDANQEFLTHVSYHNGVFFALGANGVVSKSNNGINWSASHTSMHDHMFSITHGSLHNQDMYMAVGLGGQVFTSTDGNSWESVSVSTTNDLRSVVYAKNKFVVVGNNGTILDTRFWGWDQANSGVNASLFAVTYGVSESGVDTFVTVGGDGDKGVILTSTDGENWSSQDAKSISPLYAVKYVNPTVGFVAVGESGAIITSHDGMSWESQVSGVNYTLTGVSGNGSNDIVVSTNHDGKMLVSYDGQNWEQKQADGNGKLYGVVMSPNQTISVGESGDIVKSELYQFINQPGVFVPTLNDIVYDESGTFFVVGGDSVYSYNLSTRHGSGALYSDLSNRNFVTITSDMDNNFVAVGDAGVIASSQDGGHTWTNRSGVTPENLSAVTFFDNKFIAGGRSTVINSIGGQSWSIQTPLSDYTAISITHDNNHFLMLGYDDRYSSNDNLSTPNIIGYDADYSAASWVYNNSFAADSTITAALHGIFYGVPLFIVVGDGGQIFTSESGVGQNSWKLQTSNTSEDLYDGAYAGGTYFAVGDNGTINISNNGIDWVSTTESGAQSNLRAVACSNDLAQTRCVAVGQNGALATATNEITHFNQVSH